jgi:hypothetical protein
VIFENPMKPEIAFVINNLREKSRQDIFWATDATPEFYIEFLARPVGFKWVIYHEKEPAALIGAMPRHKGVWSLFGMGTDKWTKVWRLVTLVARRDMMRAVSDAGAHRAECLSPAEHGDTHRWLRMLGATHEAPMPGYGKNGEDYILFSWLKDRGNGRLT